MFSEGFRGWVKAEPNPELYTLESTKKTKKKKKEKKKLAYISNLRTGKAETVRSMGLIGQLA